MADETDSRDGTTPEEERQLPPAPPARGKDQALWVGLFLVLGLVALLGALFVLTDAAIFRGRYIITTNVPDAGGIRRGDPVRMLGVNIGRVQRFEIQREQGRVAIRLEIEGEYEVPKDSHVELESQGIIGGMQANIIPGKSNEMVKYGDVIAGRSAPDMLANTDEIVGKVNDSLDRVARLLSDENIRNISGTTSNASAATADMRGLIRELNGTVTEQRAQLNELMGTLQRTSTRFETLSNKPELDRSFERIDTLTARMDTVTQSLDRTAKSVEAVTARFERGEGTLGRLSREDEVYKNLNEALNNMKEATANLNRLAEDVRKNPKRYFDFSVF
ncbi:MAG TPA: MlaD family protein [Vicinamibacteria bacterium]|nr:MlaD family protein [Vicinamibacteria bacterium]